MSDLRKSDNVLTKGEKAYASSSKLSSSNNGKGLNKVGSSAFNSRARETGSA